MEENNNIDNEDNGHTITIKVSGAEYAKMKGYFSNFECGRLNFIALNRENPEEPTLETNIMKLTAEETQNLFLAMALTYHVYKKKETSDE